MNTKQKIGRACMIVGILLILGALALLGYNQWDANRADKASQDALGKLEEEVRELRAALESGKAADAPHGVREEVGDALFIAAKVAQMSGVDPEDALHRACDKFDQRFRYVEAQADKPLSAYSEAELVKLWQEAKAHQHT